MLQRWKSWSAPPGSTTATGAARSIPGSSSARVVRPAPHPSWPRPTGPTYGCTREELPHGRATGGRRSAPGPTVSRTSVRSMDTCTSTTTMEPARRTTPEPSNGYSREGMGRTVNGWQLLGDARWRRGPDRTSRGSLLGFRWCPLGRVALGRVASRPGPRAGPVPRRPGSIPRPRPHHSAEPDRQMLAPGALGIEMAKSGGLTVLPGPVPA